MVIVTDSSIFVPCVFVISHRIYEILKIEARDCWGRGAAALFCPKGKANDLLHAFHDCARL